MDRAQVLLRANLEVARGVDLDQVLHHLVDAARALVGAGCAALTVTPNGQPERVVQSAGDERLLALMAEGAALFRQVEWGGGPVRVPDFGALPAAATLPDGHALRGPLLRVPIVLGGRTLGHLDLSGRPEAVEFTEQDERMAVTLAATAAVAIDNASLFAEVRRRHAWQEAMIGVTTRALAGVHTPALLRELVYHTWRASGADGAGLSLLSRRGRHVRLVVAMGVLAPFEHLSTPLEGSFAQQAIRVGRAFQFDPHQHPTSAPYVVGTDVGRVLIAPVLGAQRAFGALTVARRGAAEPFEPIDQEMVSAFAAQAGLALEYDGAPAGRPHPAHHTPGGVNLWD
ncbi:GAF domain-containing protein [Catellatospora tritici]|uniref:GAF domain-containing protein n=1 Tax=Catellatospora tritici TaxID=2851566 RepID=UPI001C2D40B3|nr:GAF domain-containing protein [Catellatospora tritici]MBV1851209.1 GAF domain-containing protein [Catellatospora tritici]